jgi:hypothetical protein
VTVLQGDQGDGANLHQVPPSGMTADDGRVVVQQRQQVRVSAEVLGPFADAAYPLLRGAGGEQSGVEGTQIHVHHPPGRRRCSRVADSG